MGEEFSLMVAKIRASETRNVYLGVELVTPKGTPRLDLWLTKFSTEPDIITL